MARVDRSSAFLRIIAIMDGIRFHHGDMIIMNAITVMNVIHVMKVESRMITPSNLDCLVMKVNKIMNAFMNFLDSWIYLIIISRVVFCSCIFASSDRFSLNISSFFCYCSIYPQNILSSLSFKGLLLLHDNLSIYSSLLF